MRRRVGSASMGNVSTATFAWSAVGNEIGSPTCTPPTGRSWFLRSGSGWLARPRWRSHWFPIPIQNLRQGCSFLPRSINTPAWRARTSKSRSLCSTGTPARSATAPIRQSASARTVSPACRHTR